MISRAPAGAIAGFQVLGEILRGEEVLSLKKQKQPPPKHNASIFLLNLTFKSHIATKKVAGGSLAQELNF